MPCDFLQPALPLGGLAIVVGLVGLTQAVRAGPVARWRLAGAIALVVVGALLLVTTRPIGCAGVRPGNVQPHRSGGS